MNTADRKVQTLLLNAAARAYDYPRPHDEGPACEQCGGDGCQTCDYTGEPT